MSDHCKQCNGYGEYSLGYGDGPVEEVHCGACGGKKTRATYRELADALKTVTLACMQAEDQCVVCRPDPDHRHEAACPVLAAERVMLKAQPLPEPPGS